jgi:RNA polymerase sigma factor (sigma-70 family)
MGPTLRARASSRDLLQECLLGLSTALPRASLLDEPSLLRYASTIVRRRAVDLLRKRQHAALDELASAGGTLPVPAPGPGPSTLGARSEQVDRLRAGLARLPPDERLVIEMRDLQGVSFERIAEELHRSGPKAVRLLRWRAMRRLSGLMDGEG